MVVSTSSRQKKFFSCELKWVKISVEQTKEDIPQFLKCEGTHAMWGQLQLTLFFVGKDFSAVNHWKRLGLSWNVTLQNVWNSFSHLESERRRKRIWHQKRKRPGKPLLCFANKKTRALGCAGCWERKIAGKTVTLEQWVEAFEWQMSVRRKRSWPGQV